MNPGSAVGGHSGSWWGRILEAGRRFSLLRGSETWTHDVAVFCVRRQWSTGMLVGMYLRVTSRTNADGSVVRYVALAHNERTDGQTRARVLRGLGREDGLDTDGLRRLVSPVSRFLGDADPYVAGSGKRADLLRMTSSRSMGGAWLLDGLWKQLGIDVALRQLLGPRRFSTDVERVLFALVANRALDPSSKLAASEWAERDAAIGGPGSMSDDQAYRAMDLLIKADAAAKVREVRVLRRGEPAEPRDRCAPGRRDQHLLRGRARCRRQRRAGACGATGIARTTGPTSPRSSSGWP